MPRMITFRRRLAGKISLLCFVAIGMLITAPDRSLGAADLVRPCGPDSLTGPLRKLIPQGVAGADFRPICVRHDACYDTYGANKGECDRRYLDEMKCACRNSRHPLRCRITARIMYAFTHRGGQAAFDDAQRIARQKLYGY